MLVALVFSGSLVLLTFETIAAMLSILRIHWSMCV
jgi:hypothetical protein